MLETVEMNEAFRLGTGVTEHVLPMIVNADLRIIETSAGLGRESVR